MTEPLTIRSMSAEDWPAVRAIYEEGIASGDATFELAAPAWASWDASHMTTCRLVALDRDRQLLGFAALSPVSSRCVYAGVAEISVYIAARARGQGIGTVLLGRLVEAAEASGVWTLQAGIFPENVASLALHTRAGFRVVGRRERLGQMHGRWRDVLLLERRSATVGQ